MCQAWRDLDARGIHSQDDLDRYQREQDQARNWVNSHSIANGGAGDCDTGCQWRALARAFEGCSGCASVDWTAWKAWMAAASNYDLAQGMIAGKAYSDLAEAMWVASNSIVNGGAGDCDAACQSMAAGRANPAPSGSSSSKQDCGRWGWKCRGETLWDVFVGSPAYATYYVPNRAIHYGVGDNPAAAVPRLRAEIAGFGIYSAENVIEHKGFDTPAIYTDDRYKSLDPREHDELDKPGGLRFYAPGPCRFQVPLARRSDC